MDNVSSWSMLTMTSLNESRSNRIIIFSFALPGYCLTIFTNLTLIFIIYLEKVLHEPMYIFLCNLCVNGLFGATSFYPKFFSDVLNQTNSVSVINCVIQVYMILFYVVCEFTNITVMAFDRYLAICRPLHYRGIMTPVTIGKLLTFIWMFPQFSALTIILLTTRFSICVPRLDKVFCDSVSLERIACHADTIQFVVNAMFMFFITTLVCFVFFSYCRIIAACMRSKESRKKFVNTCVPHLITFLNYITLTLFDALNTRFGARDMQQSLRNFVSVTFIIIPPCFNPIIYGISLSLVRAKIVVTFRQILPKCK